MGLSWGHLLHVYRVLNLQSESNKNMVNTDIFVFSFVIDQIKNKKQNEQTNKQTNIHFLLVYMKLTSLNCIKNKKPKYLLSLTGNLRNERKM